MGVLKLRVWRLGRYAEQGGASSAVFFFLEATKLVQRAILLWMCSCSLLADGVISQSLYRQVVRQASDHRSRDENMWQGKFVAGSGSLSYSSQGA